jgi:hypothetical protein
MSYFRSYFEKNNTILKSSYINTSKNPNTDIYYGSSHSKFIFKIDLTNLKDKLDNGDLILNNNTKHYLRLTNTIFGDETFKGKTKFTSKDRAYSFDLILFKINEDWDEGVGFNYTREDIDLSNDNNKFLLGPSNWYQRNSLNRWSEDGIFNNNPDIITTIHFDNGDENIDVDITTHINDILLYDVANFGIGLCFSLDYFTLNVDRDQSVSFFTKYTQTFFEPYLETVFNDRIDDNRYNFIPDTFQNLYLYVTKNGNFHNLESLPSVDILTPDGNVYDGFFNLTPTLVRKGIYKLTLNLPAIVCQNKKMMFDLWKNINIEGITMSNVKQKFIINDYSTTFNVGENKKDTNNYILQYHGIKQTEKIKRGEIRKLAVEIKNMNSIVNLLHDVYFRIYVKEGLTQINVHDWTLMDKTNENSYMLDTTYFIPREYYMEFKSRINNEEKYFKDSIKFEIINEK